MQTEDNYAPRRTSTEETVRVEPQAVLDRYEDDRSDTSSVSNEGNRAHESERDTRAGVEPEIGTAQPDEPEADDRESDSDRKPVKTENDDERWGDLMWIGQEHVVFVAS